MNILDFENYIFDLDGTIIDSSKGVLSCFAQAFQKSNIQIDKTRLNSDVIGPPLKDILVNIHPAIKDDDKKVDEVILNFRSIYDNSENDDSSLYEGIEDFIKDLSKEGKKMFIATLKPTIPTIRILKYYGLYDYFEDIYTIDKFSKNMKKSEMLKSILHDYRLENSKTVMIGDSIGDMQAAKDNTIYAVGVLWGYCYDKFLLKNLSNSTIKKINKRSFV